MHVNTSSELNGKLLIWVCPSDSIMGACIISPEGKADTSVNWSVAALSKACLTSRSPNLPVCFIFRVYVGSTISLISHGSKLVCSVLRESRVVTRFLFNLWNSLAVSYLELNIQAANLEGCQGVLEGADPRSCWKKLCDNGQKDMSVKFVRGFLKNTALWWIS